jgi:hypothetical protein
MESPGRGFFVLRKPKCSASSAVGKLKKNEQRKLLFSATLILFNLCYSLAYMCYH